MRTKMLQRRLEKLEAVQTDDPPALVIYSWVSPEETGKQNLALQTHSNRSPTAGQGAGRLKLPGRVPAHSACGEEEAHRQGFIVPGQRPPCL